MAHSIERSTVELTTANLRRGAIRFVVADPGRNSNGGAVGGPQNPEFIPIYGGEAN